MRNTNLTIATLIGVGIVFVFFLFWVYVRVAYQLGV